LRIDDALEVSSVHGVSSFVGTLAIGFFAYRGEKSGSSYSSLSLRTPHFTARVQVLV
jgi:ammonia channel protein AmtB